MNVDGLQEYPDASHVAAHAALLAASIGETSTPPVSQPGLANNFVSVVTGPLFTSRSEFHLQSQISWLMPRTTDTDAFAAAVTHWRNTAPFHGIPFRANLKWDEIQHVLKTLGATKRIAVTVLPICKTARDPAILLIGVDPVVLATAVNCSSKVADDWEPELPGTLAGPKPTYGKFGYVFKWSDVTRPSKNYQASATVYPPSFRPSLYTVPSSVPVHFLLVPSYSHSHNEFAPGNEVLPIPFAFHIVTFPFR